MTDNNGSPRAGRLVEVWGDTVDQRHLGCAIAIGVAISLGGFLGANHVLAASVSRPELARTYAMLAGLVGCVIAGVVCAFLFKPKRLVIEGRDADPFWRQDVLEKLAGETGDLGAIADLPASVIQEMKELEIYELFASFRPASRIADAAVEHARRPSHERGAAAARTILDSSRSA